MKAGDALYKIAQGRPFSTPMGHDKDRTLAIQTEMAKEILMARLWRRLTGINYVMLVHIAPDWCGLQLARTEVPSRSTGMRVISPPVPCLTFSFSFSFFEKVGAREPAAEGFSLSLLSLSISPRGSRRYLSGMYATDAVTYQISRW
jgi:hypothetical protein